MLLVLTVFFSIYSAIHAFCYFRLRVLLWDHFGFRLLFILFMILMMIAPIAARFLEYYGHDGPARILALIGYTWMGFILLFLWGAFFISLVEWIGRLLNPILPFHWPQLTGRTPMTILLGSVILIGLYATFESFQIKVERLQIATAKLPAQVTRLRIVQVSDIHLGLTARERRLKSILQIAARQNPDILVSTGDLLDGSVLHLNRLAELFQQVQTKHGKYAVTGNHEFYVGLGNSIAFHDKAGLQLLRGEFRTIPGLINIVGVDDQHIKSSKDAAALLSSNSNGLFTLFLKHRPDIDTKTLGLFDLQLSGHTHAGQIYLYNFLVARFYPYLKGYIELSSGSRLYVNRGSGTWGPQMRLFTHPEVTVIDIVPGSLLSKSEGLAD